MAETKMSLKLLVDTSKNKVIVAEAEKMFIDFLFGILALPIGTVITHIRGTDSVGCLENLYRSVENLDVAYIQPNQSKDNLLNPQLPASVPKLEFLLQNTESSSTKVFYTCGSNIPAFSIPAPSGGCGSLYVSEYPGAICPACKGFMRQNLQYVNPPAETDATSTDKKGYVKGPVTFMVMDDLDVKPMSGISSIALLNKLNVKDVGCLEERAVNIGMNEAVKLIRTSWQSKTVLTDAFLKAKDVELS